METNKNSEQDFFFLPEVKNKNTKLDGCTQLGTKFEAVDEANDAIFQQSFLLECEKSPEECCSDDNGNVEVLGEIYLPIPNQVLMDNEDDKFKLTMELRFTHPKQISVKSAKSKKLSVDVDPTDSIADVKKRLSVLEDVPPNKQRLFLGADELTDSRPLCEYILDEDIVLDLACMWRVNVKNRRSHSSFHIDFWTSENVADVRAKISNEINLKMDSFRLFCNRELMEDKEKMTKYIKHNQAEILLETVKQVHVHMPSGAVLTLDIWSSETVGDVKRRISKVEGLPTSHQRLIHCGEQVEDTMQISNCNSTADDTVFELDTLHFVNAKTTPESCITMQVWSSDTIASVKEKVASIRHQPSDDHRLLFQKLELDDLRQIKDYCIPQFAEIDAEHCWKLMISRPNELPFIFHAWPSESISELMTRIAENEDTNPDFLRLSLEGAYLEDDRRLDEYLVKSDTIFELETILNLTVLSPAHERIIVDVWSSTLVIDVQMKLQDLKGIPVNKQRLTYEGQMLKEEARLINYKIRCDSVLKWDYLRPFVLVMDNDQRMSVEMWHYDLVSDLKNRLETIKGLPIDQQRITVDGNVLHETCKLSECIFNNDAALNVQQLRRIYVDFFSENVGIDVWPTDNVLDLKKKLSDAKGIKMEDQRLTLGKEELTDVTEMSDVFDTDSKFELESFITATIQTPFDKLINIKAWPSQTFKFLKERIQEHEGLSANRIRIKLGNGQNPPDNALLSDLLCYDSYIELDCLITILFETATQEKIPIDIWTSSTIAELKTLCDNQRIYYNNRELKDEKKVSDFGIKDQSVIQLEQLCIVKVIFDSGDLYHFQLWPSDQVQRLKEKIAIMQGVPSKGQRLVVGTKVLDATELILTIKDSLVELECLRQISLTTPSGYLITVDVWGSDSVRYVKMKVSKILTIPDDQLRFKFDKNYLTDDQRLPREVFMENATILIEQSFVVHILIQKKVFVSCFVWPSDDVQKLKTEIERMTGFTSDRLRLYFTGLILENKQLLKDLAVQSNSEINLEVQRKLIVLQDGKKEAVIVNAWSSISVSSLKDKLQQVIGVPLNHQKLTFEGMEMSDTHCLSFYCKERYEIEIQLSRTCPVTIAVRNESTTVVFMWSYESVLDLKDVIYDMEGKKPDQQCLSLDNKELTDGQLISNLDLQSDSVIKVKFITKTYVSMPPEEALNRVVPVDTTDSLKEEIHGTTSVEAPEENLLINEAKLDETELDGANVDKTKSGTQSFPDEAEPLTLEHQTTLNIKTTNILISCFTLCSYDNVSKLKMMIAEKDHISADNLMLFNECRLLRDDEKISTFDSSTSLQALIKPYGNFIMIWEPTIRIMTAVETSQTQSVCELKRICIERLGVLFNNQILIFRSKVLEERVILSDIGVERGSIITLLRRRAQTFRLLRGDLENDVITELCDDSEENNEKLIFSSRLLTPDRTLRSEGLTNSCEVHVMVEVEDLAQIVVRRTGQNALILSDNLSSTVLDLKLKIETITGIPAEIQELSYFNDINSLSDCQSISPFEVEEGFFVLTYQLKVSVQMLGSRTVDLKINNDRSIESLKRQLEPMIGVQASRQRLLLNGREVQNQKPVGSYLNTKVEKAALCFALTIRELRWIFVRTELSQVVSLDVSPCDSVVELKRKISQMLGISPVKQRLLFNGEVLNEKDTLVKKSIPDEAMLMLEERVDQELQVEIREEGRRRRGTRLEVRSSDRILDIKAKVQERENLPRCTFELSFAGIPLADDSQLMCYDVSNGSQLTRSKVPKLPVYVRALNGKEVELFVCPTSTVQKVKRKIKSALKVAVPLQELYFEGQLLADERCLFSYTNSVKAMTLFLARTDEHCIWVFARNLQGCVFGLRFFLSESLTTLSSEVKQELQIEGRVRIMVDQFSMKDWF